MQYVFWIILKYFFEKIKYFAVVFRKKCIILQQIVEQLFFFAFSLFVPRITPETPAQILTGSLHTNFWLLSTFEEVFFSI
jgi:hypothetical protein